MQKIFLISLVLLAAVLWVPCYGESGTDVTVLELVENGHEMDGAQITLTVEAIGDTMKRGEFAWVNGLDSSGAIGFWMSSAQAEDIDILGNGKYKGDIFRISGVFHRACTEHGGDMDVHVTGMEKVASGYPLNRKISKEKVSSAVALTLFGLIVGSIFIRQRFR